MKRLLTSLLFCAAIFSALRNVSAADAGEKPLNLLFIMTDQQRWDAMSCAGNTMSFDPPSGRFQRVRVRQKNLPISVPGVFPFVRFTVTRSAS